VNTFYLHPADVGLRRAAIEDLAGGTAADNATLIEALLAGERGPRRDIVLLNAGAALLVAGRVPTLAGGIARAGESLDRAAARRILDRLREVCGR
jgi:anthranilate phosphoribosyltransferase